MWNFLEMLLRQFVTNPECEPAIECWSIQPRFIRIRICFYARVDEVLDNAESIFETWW
jgi:hypothetical protein